MIDLIPVESLDSIKEGIVLLDGVKVVELNAKAREMGFNENAEIFDVFSTPDMDELVESILDGRDFKRNTRAYFFKLGTFRDVVIDFKGSVKILTVDDVSRERELNTAKRDFVISVSHELFNPISALKGNLMLLKDMEEDEVKLEIMEKIERTLERIERIIKQLKFIAMAELNLYRPKMQPIDPRKVFREVITELSDKIESKGIEIDCEARVETIETDGFVFYILVRNLVSNAVKYSNPGGKVKVIVDEEKLIVRDRGIGIRDDEKTRIFERFFRGTEAKRMAGGSGLGLAVVKHLCDMMGYRVDFSSKWLVGSEFVVYFK